MHDPDDDSLVWKMNLARFFPKNKEISIQITGW